MAAEIKHIVGVDVSKDTLAVTILQQTEYLSFRAKNEGARFEEELSKRVSARPSEVLVVMEATGVYHLKLACDLYRRGYRVSVVNPFVIKKYAEMRMKRVKTDAVDSRTIAEYGRDNLQQIRLFEPKRQVQYEMEAKLKILDDLNSSLRRFQNQRHAMSYYPGEGLTKAYDEIIEKIRKEIEEIEEELMAISQKYYKREYRLLISIPGVGKKLAWAIISFLKGFEDFETAKQVASYIGCCPHPWESGKKVKKGKISRKGSAFFRRILYVCAWSASRYNKDCRQLYERLIGRGKSKKEAMVAVANKLIRQAFGVLKGGIGYIPEFHLVRESLNEGLT